jgi:hypothetical protein
MNHRTSSLLTCLVVAYSLFAPAIGFTEQEDFVVFNHSRESLTLREVSFQDDNGMTKKPDLECASGERILLLKEPELARKVQNVSFRIELPVRIELPDRTASEEISVSPKHPRIHFFAATKPK